MRPNQGIGHRPADHHPGNFTLAVHEERSGQSLDLVELGSLCPYISQRGKGQAVGAGKLG